MTDTMLAGKRVLVTGGTGSLGQTLVRRLLRGALGMPASVLVYSRDEAKQHAMRLAYARQPAATDDVAYESTHRLRFRIGDVADYGSMCAALRQAEIVFHAAAMKQVPTCELAPYQAVRTNVQGAENIARAIREHNLPVEMVVAVSTDKACKPVNVMGMTKALQERILVQANLDCPGTRFVVARYGNVLASRGSVIPLFHDQIRRGGPVTLTTPEMTRFLMSLEQAVDTILAAALSARRGETFIPRLRSARMVDVAGALIGNRAIETSFNGIRPGEKVNEILISEEEAPRTVVRGEYLAIQPILPELRSDDTDILFGTGEYSSADHLFDRDGVEALLRANGLLLEDRPAVPGALTL
jgi:UDP-glucose 4-epimerase